MIVTRFAPSPTGLLHLGHARAAILAWQRARDACGRFLLRLEDIDAGRCRPEFARAIVEDLAWLGLDWDGKVRVQSHHFAQYRAVLDRLAARGLIYPCFCTRRAIREEIAQAASAPHAPDGSPIYPGTCRALSVAEREGRIAAGEAYALRLDMARALAGITTTLAYVEHGAGLQPCQPALFGDVVLGRRDVPASYHLCVTHDDAMQRVTLVNRGVDLQPATAIHRLLQALMGWSAPVYAHHALVTDATGRRLAKRDGAVTLRALRAQGHTPAAVRARAGCNRC